MLDPCMGSGHFLVFALPILTRMRMEEEALPLKEALVARYYPTTSSGWKSMVGVRRLRPLMWHLQHGG